MPDSACGRGGFADRRDTIREKLDTCRFAHHKDKVIALLMRVTRVSVETQDVVEQMRARVR